MTESLCPERSEHIQDILAWAMEKNVPLAVRARGTKTTLGRATAPPATLDLSRLSGITLYEPEELVLQASAATPLAEIEAALAAKNQMLAFEPPDLGPLLGGDAARGSIGGVLACNLAGSRRIKAGAARDHFLGASAYAGRGELFKTGGRVVKNVTGYDLCKLLAGSYGTLAVMTDVTVKVLPAPEKTRTVLLFGLDETQATAAMTKALSSAHEVSGAAHLPAAIAGRSRVSRVAGAGSGVTALRIEGPPASVAHRCTELRALLGGAEELHSTGSVAFWREVGNAAAFVGDPRAVWRISVAPQAGPAIAAAMATLENAAYYLDWGGGLIWAAVPETGDAGAVIIRRAIAASGGGHATLIRGAAALRERIPVFEPQPEALAALTRRLKQSFDPKGVLNPGRITADM
jgi:glycolate oxidase FAD binding subunit